MASARQVGHDARGSTIYREDENFRPLIEDGKRVVADDVPVIQRQLRALRAGHEEENEFGFRLSSADLENYILIPRYYDRSFEERLGVWARENSCHLVSPRELLADEIISIRRGHGSMKSQWYSTDSGVPYIRTSNISGLEIEYQSRHVVKIPEEIYERASRRKFTIRANDILFVRRGEDRIGDVAIVYPGFERILVAGEIDVIRIEHDNSLHLTPYSLLYLLSHPLVREQFNHKMFYETIIWNIGDRWLDVLLPVPMDTRVIRELSDQVQRVVEQRRLGLEQMRDLYRSPVLPTRLEPSSEPALAPLSD
jgi:hypothetical protein